MCNTTGTATEENSEKGERAGVAKCSQIDTEQCAVRRNACRTSEQQRNATRGSGSSDRSNLSE